MRAVVSVATDYPGQPMIAQIKSGGGGAIGTETAAKASPDGYTLLAGGPGWNITLPAFGGRSRGPEDLAAAGSTTVRTTSSPGLTPLLRT